MSASDQPEAEIKIERILEEEWEEDEDPDWDLNNEESDTSSSTTDVKTAHRGSVTLKTKRKRKKRNEKQLEEQRKRRKLKKQNETPEEREARLEKDRERKRRRIEALSEEEKQARLEKERERHRLKRQREREFKPNIKNENGATRAERIRERDQVNPEGREARLERDRERKKRRREALTEEENQARLEKERERQRLKRKRFPEKEREYKRKSLKDPTRLERIRERDRENRKRCRERAKLEKERKLKELEDTLREELKSQSEVELKPAEIETKVQKMMKERKNEMFPRKKNIQNSRKMADLTEEEREYIRTQRYFYKQSLPEESIQKRREQSNRYYHEVIKNDPVKLNRFRAQLNSYAKKRYSRMPPEKVEEHKKRIAEYYRKRRESETPEQRQRTLHSYKVTQAKQKLKKRLLAEGYPLEEVKVKMAELGEEMWNSFTVQFKPVSKYTPKPERKPLKYRRDGVTETKPLVNQGIKVDYTLGLETSSDVNFLPGKIMEGSTFANDSMASASKLASESFAEFTEEFHYKCPEPDWGSEDYDDQVEAVDTFQTDPDELEPEPLPIQPSFACLHCILTFLSESELREHLLSSHPKKCWKCPKCKEVMFSSPQLAEHFREKHATAKKKPVEALETASAIEIEKAPTGPTRTYLKFSCVKCPSISPDIRSFAQLSELKEHVQQKHPEAYFPCIHCGLLRYSKKSLDIHVKSHEQVKKKKGKR